MILQQLRDRVTVEAARLVENLVVHRDEAWRLTLSHNRGSKIYYDQARRVTFIIRLSRPLTTTTSGSVVVAIQSPWRHEL